MAVTGMGRSAGLPGSDGPGCMAPERFGLTRVIPMKVGRVKVPHEHGNVGGPNGISSGPSVPISAENPPGPAGAGLIAGVKES